MKVLSALAVALCAMSYLTAQEITFFTPCDTIEFCTSPNDCGPVAVNLFADASTTCASGGLEFSYTIDLDDDGSVDVSETGNMNNDSYPVGSHRVVFTATDDCANEEVCDFLFLIEDCIPPVVVADSFLTGETMENCIFELFAEEVDNGSHDNCGIETMLIVSPSQGQGQTEPPSVASESWVFSGCDDFGTHTLDLWMSDEAGNWSYDVGFVLVQDNLAPFCSCPQNVVCPYSETESGGYVYDVIYYVEQDIPGFPELELVSDDCEILPANVEITVTPEKNINPLNGVSTFDLVLISRHLLNIEPLDSPYKIIAADVNNSGSVSTLDMLDLRKLVLGISDTFPNNTSWRFVDPDFDFPNLLDPWETPFPEFITFEGYESFVDFIGIKVGDINLNANLGLVTEIPIDQRSVFDFEIPNQLFKKGELVNVDFYAKEIEQYTGFQFGLEYNTAGLKFKKIKKGSLKYLDENNIGVKEAIGEIAISWINSNLDQIEQSENPLFRFQFEALQDGTLKDFLKQSNTVLSSEAYTNDLSISNIDFHFSEGTLDQSFSLISTPNPFRNEVTIEFDLLKAEEVNLKILDINGRLLKSIDSNCKEGRNMITISPETFPGSGIYFCQLNTSEKNYTSKILKLE